MALERAKKIKFGDPMNMETDLGTVVNAQAAELFDKRVSMAEEDGAKILYHPGSCLLYTSPSPRDLSTSRMPSSA